MGRVSGSGDKGDSLKKKSGESGANDFWAIGLQRERGDTHIFTLS